MKSLAINVRRLRLSKGLSQGQLAEEAGVSRPTIGAIEDVTGESSPSIKTISKVAEALETDIATLMDQRDIPKRIRFRAMREFKSREQVVVDALHAYDMYKTLEEAAGRSLPPGVKLREFRKHIDKSDKTGIERAKWCAQELRKQMGIESPDIPVPRITTIIEQLDVRVITIPNHIDAFGLSFEAADLNPVIVVNMNDRITVERWIFSAAHELGHLILHWDGDISFNEATEDPDVENEANAFAAELLIPRDGFEHMQSALAHELLIDKVMAIKRRFVVSYQTVIYRMSELPENPEDTRTGKERYKDVLNEFLAQYSIRYGQELTRKEEGAIKAHSTNYDPHIIPVSYTSEEPENAGSGAPRLNMFLPQGRMMRLLIDGIRWSKLSVSEVERILYASDKNARKDALYFYQRVKGIVD